MPYKSDAQRRFFHYALSKGKIDANTVKEYDEASRGMDLPEKTKFGRLKNYLSKGKK